MSDDIVLRADGLSKCFKIYTNPWDRAWEWMTLGRQTRHKEFWAVKDISFEVKRGQFLGIIGPNGAGKSTLLKMVSGVLHPTEGSFQAQGRVLSLLELSAGLDKELTGRENALRHAELLEFPDDYIHRRMAQIKEFSELSDFFERPINLYSTGMRTRLAFSLFAFLECDVLILDEVLAVGDIFFRQKCFARLDELIAQDTAIILVTHNMGIVQRYCDEVMVLHKGAKIYQGQPDEAIRTFMHLRGDRDAKLAEIIFKQEVDELEQQFGMSDSTPTKEEFFWPPEGTFMPISPADQKGAGRARLVRLAICSETGDPCQAFKQGEDAYFCYEFELKRDIGIPIGSIDIRDQYNVLIHGKNSLQHNTLVPHRIRGGSRLRFSQRIGLGLAPGPYTFSLSLLTLSLDDYVHLDQLSYRELNQKRKYLCRVKRAGAFTVMPRFGERLERLHGGLCDLPGDCQIQLVTNSQPWNHSQVTIQAEARSE
jgi:lipopolysaccharide transport system ATP-binding protein